MTELWYPGSFTKNFGWGSEKSGLIQLHKAIRKGFGDQAIAVPRNLFRERLSNDSRSYYIPANFFLFNFQDGGEDYLAVDELVFQALSFPHSSEFDKLALFAFNLSIVGRWSGARRFQSRPALWANRYIIERLSRIHNWNSSKVNAGDIENFLIGDQRYQGKTTRKLSTNLAYLYRLGKLQDVAQKEVERWWSDAVFLAADRLFLSNAVERLLFEEIRAGFSEIEFQGLTGVETISKAYSMERLLRLYIQLGGIGRFEVSKEMLSQGAVNDPRPLGLIDRMLPRAPKSIPSGSINPMDLEAVGYESQPMEELLRVDVADVIRDFALKGLQRLQNRNIVPTLSSTELHKLLRE